MNSFIRRSNFQKMLGVSLILLGAMYLGVGLVTLVKPVLIGEKLYVGGDFIAFYGAGMIADTGRAAEAYDAEKYMETIQTLAPDLKDRLLWSYPPPMFLFLDPIAQLSARIASIVWLFLSILVVVSLTKIAGVSLGGSVAFAGLPSLLVLYGYGNAGFFMAGFMAVGLILVYQGKNRIGGMVLSGLLLKPHLALFVVPFLLIRKKFTAVTTMALFAIVLVFVAWGVYGFEIFESFINGVSANTADVLQKAERSSIMASAYGLFRSIGIPSVEAVWLHAIYAGLLSVLTLVLLYRDAPEWLKYLLVVPTTLSIFPQSFIYDLPIIFLLYPFLYKYGRNLPGRIWDYIAGMIVGLLLFIPTSDYSGPPLGFLVVLITYTVVVKNILLSRRRSVCDQAE